MHVGDRRIFVGKLWVFVIGAEKGEPVSNFMSFSGFGLEFLDVDLLELYLFNLLLYHSK